MGAGQKELTAKTTATAKAKEEAGPPPSAKDEN
jgi:hypothetical protein